MIRIEYANGRIRFLTFKQLHKSMINEVKEACKDRIKDYEHCYVGDIVRGMGLDKSFSFYEQVAIALQRTGRYEYEKVQYKNTDDIKIKYAITSNLPKWATVADWVAAIAALSLLTLEVLRLLKK
ncbi:MAG TPA: hypothetical protein VFD56_00740, partial [Chitinophagaceae bacterium]|nr:hypothetical protein [Chitinophagaceae bacterium]